MSKVTIYGASDDLIEVDGDISEEFNPPYKGDGEVESMLVFGDGTVLGVTYTESGIWRIVPKSKGSAKFDKVDGVDDENYTDRVTLEGDLRWCVFAKVGQFVKSNK